MEPFEYELEKSQLELGEVKEELDRTIGLYRKMCESPLAWFVRPLDARIDNRELMHCDCNGYFWLDGDAEATTHHGHHYRRAIETSVWVYLKARYFPSLIK